MKCIKAKVNAELKAGNIGSDTACEYYPCHCEGMNCSLCYCPFYPCDDTDLGKFIKGKNGKKIFDCSDCMFCHDNQSVKLIFEAFGRLGISDAGDPRIMDVFPELKDEYLRRKGSVSGPKV